MTDSNTITLTQKRQITGLEKCQVERLNFLMRYSCRLWNACIEQNESIYWKNRDRNGRFNAKCDLYKPLSYFDNCKHLTEIRKDPEHKAIPVSIQRGVLDAINTSFKSFFALVRKDPKARPPSFKASSKYASISFAEGGFKVVGNKVIIRSMKLTLKLTRSFEGDLLNNCKITREGQKGSYKYYVCIPARVPVKNNNADECIGIDMGVHKVASLSDGWIYDNLRFFKQEERQLRIQQRKMARRARVDKNGKLHGEQSKGWKEAHKAVKKIHKRIANRRDQFLHKITTAIARNYALVAIENLNVKGITRSSKGNEENPGKMVKQKAGLNKAILDVAFGKFADQLKYKCEKYGVDFRLVHPAYTSQDCNNCGHRFKTALSERTRKCPECGHVHDRDINAAANILDKALGAG